ncbi:MAG: hypothetical protein H6819_07760 [Phycisphaerales bacterium]|nr:hypothetical protein [Phycisphaerales bacterium]MCB9854330.1 hypothetical protein [Phycisphaerales bacterium]MCB9863531.1 hypothetical protein [Phycisphaerales bacterium]
MMDQNYVIVHCPKGHELQAAREHLTATLSCPVCGIEFVPQAAAGVAGLAAPAQTPTPLSYAGNDLLTHPIDYPGVTTAMIWLWMIVAIASVLQVLVAVIVGPPPAVQPGQMPNINPGYFVFSLIVGCSLWICIAVAVVLQLMWIYRIHKDALRARRYSSISPGLALGLSFVPVFNYIWTALTMRKLSSFVATSADMQDPQIANQVARSQKATLWCLIAAIVVVLSGCAFMSYFGVIGWNAAQASLTPNGQLDQVAFQAALQSKMTGESVWLQVAFNFLGLFVVLLYVSAVRRLEAVLYPFLGAPQK